MKILYIPSLDKRSADVNKIFEVNYPQTLLEKNPEMVIKAGGDGAMFHMIEDNLESDAIFFGIARGTLNVLMNDIANIKFTIDQILANPKIVHVVTTSTISVSINDQIVGEAVNEVLLGREIMDFHRFVIDSQDESYEDFVFMGAGLSVATALGSTGFNLNNGGKILPLQSGLWSVTSIASEKNINDLISKQKLRIKTEAPELLIDARSRHPLAKNDVVTLEMGRKLKLGFLDKYSFLRRRVELSTRR